MCKDSGDGEGKEYGGDIGLVFGPFFFDGFSVGSAEFADGDFVT